MIYSLTSELMPRTDKKRNIDKVSASLAKNPLQTEREIALDTGLWHWTINRAKKEVEQSGAKDPRIITLTDWDMRIMNIIQKQKEERLQDPKVKVNNSDIDKRSQTATRRYSLFRWNATDKDWWIILLATSS